MGIVRSNRSLKHERKQKNDIIDNEVIDGIIIEENVEEDVIAVFARYTKDLLLIISAMIGKLQKSSCYTVLARTTQPAHFVTAVSVLFVAHLCIARKDAVNVSPICTLVYLGSFSVHLGAQIWMTFVSGLSLYFSIPRHTFGNVQQVLFPKYFLLNAVLSLITLTLFLKSQNQIITNLQTSMQVLAMVVCFLIELIIRLYFTPPLIELIRDKNQKEEEAGVGKEIGKFNPGTLLNDSVYLEIHIRFRKLHKVIAIGNIITMGCTMLHLYYLSQRIIIM